MKIGRLLRPCCRRRLRSKVPARQRATAPAREPRGARARAQGAAARGLRAAGDEARNSIARPGARAGRGGYQALFASGEGCCGALRTHLGRSGRRSCRHAPQHRCLVAAGRSGLGRVASSINASGCSQMVKQYAHAPCGTSPLRRQSGAHIGARARSVRALARARPHVQRADSPRRGTASRVPSAVHAAARPAAARCRVAACARSASRLLCRTTVICAAARPEPIRCSSPRSRRELRDRKLGSLGAARADCIVSANIGCIQHLQSGTAMPVRHWIEVLDQGR